MRGLRFVRVVPLVLALVGATASAAPDAAQQLIFVGIRPLKGAGGAGDLGKLGDAQQLRATAEASLAQATQQPILGHDDLRKMISNDYLVKWFNCASKLECIAKLLAPLRNSGFKTAVTGEYFVDDKFHIHLTAFSIEDGKVGKELQLELTPDEVKDAAVWTAKLAPLGAASSGHVRLVLNVSDTACTLDGQPCTYDGDGQTLTMKPGDHTIELTKDGFKPEKLVVTVKAAATQELAVAMKPLIKEKPVVGPGETPQQGNRGPSLTVIRTDTPPAIDGKIDDAVWQKAWLETNLTQNFPDENKPPTERTEIRVLYDDTAIYVAVRCFDSQPDSIVAQLTRRDRDIESDKVTVDISSKNDHASAFHFEVNAAGRQLDGTRFNDTGASNDWDGLWYSGVTMDKLGWSAEIAIPLVALRYNGDTTSMGFQVRRYLQRRQEVDEWSYVPRSAQGEVSYYGEIEGMTGLNAKRLFQIAPYDSRSLTYRTKQGPIDGSDFGGNIGADMKLGLTPALTLDATINPDFGTVEVDQVVLNLSTVETFFPEKRPFFLEGADLFATTFQLFYSRRIGRTPPSPFLTDGSVVDVPPQGQILGALKMTGLLANRLSIGFLDAVTAREDTTIDRGMGGGEEKLLVDPLTNFGVLRLRQEFGTNSGIGVIATAVNHAEPSNAAAPVMGDLCPRPHGGLTGVQTPVNGRCTSDAYTGGGDFILRTADGTWGASGQVVGSILEGGPPRRVPDGTTINPGDPGLGVVADVGKYGGEHLLYKFHYSYYSPRLDINDAGFLGSANDQFFQSNLTLRSTKPVAGFRNASVSFITNYELFADTGAPTGRGQYLKLAAQLPNFWTIGITGGPYLPYYNNRETRDGALLENPTGYIANLSLKTDPRKSFIVTLSSANQRTTRGVNSSASLAINLRPLSFLEFDVISDGSYSYGDPRFIGKESTGDNSPSLYTFSDLDSRSFDVLFRGTITFSSTLSLQTYAQAYVDSGHYGRFTSAFGQGAHPRLELKDRFDAPKPLNFSNDFRDSTINVNAFLRWEYRPGSALWLVYTRSQDQVPYDDTEGNGRLRFDKFNGPSTDVILVKLTYLWQPLS